MVKNLLFLLAFVCVEATTYAQESYDWHEARWAIGICEPDTGHIFHRLPARLEAKVTAGVWRQSTQSAGEYLHFKTTARNFVIRYTVAGKNYAMPHMPATGMSGVDLFGKDVHGGWNWSPPRKYSFGDTCVYEYRDLSMDAGGLADFYLYLPLYAELRWITVGVPEGQKFEYSKPDKDKPIVAYGTSIMQGAVASRAGMAWTNILERNISRKVINLGFSGNGRFDAPVFDIMAGVDAKLYILDCMPNLVNKKTFPADTVRTRLIYGINKLRAQHPDVPILLAEHAAGNMPLGMDTASINAYHEASNTITEIFNGLKRDGIKELYMLTEKEINFDVNSTTDGTHPDDYGMVQYAVAYEKKIREILHEPKGELSTQSPVEQYRDGFDWRKRHEDIISNIEKTNPQVIIFANSIINYWGGEPKAEKVAGRGEAAWQQYMVPLHAQNAGFGWDRIENVLWRVYHGELDHFKGNKIVIMIGTNNLGLNKDEEIIKGLTFLVQQVRYRKPTATILLGGILPRGDMMQRVLKLNPKMKVMAAANGCKFFDLSKSFMNGSALNDALFTGDRLHPNERGYQVLGEQLNAVLKK